MIGLLAALFALAALLPIIGLARLLWRAQRAVSAAEAAETRGFTWDEVDAMFGDRVSAPRSARASVLWDIGLVGTGLVAGAVASIASLFLP